MLVNRCAQGMTGMHTHAHAPVHSLTYPRIGGDTLLLSQHKVALLLPREVPQHCKESCFPNARLHLF